jgi:hypothetical protein
VLGRVDVHIEGVGRFGPPADLSFWFCSTNAIVAAADGARGDIRRDSPHSTCIATDHEGNRLTIHSTHAIGLAYATPSRRSPQPIAPQGLTQPIVQRVQAQGLHLSSTLCILRNHMYSNGDPVVRKEAQ